MQKREEFSSNIMCGLFSKQTEPPFFLQHRSIFMVPTSLQGPCMHEGLQYKWANSKHQSPLEKIVICALTLRSGCAQMFWPGKYWRPKNKNLFLFFFFSDWSAPVRGLCQQSRQITFSSQVSVVLIGNSKNGVMLSDILSFYFNRDTGRIALKVNDCPIS